MVTRIKLDREYILQGVVVDRATQRAAPGLLVEAWDRDTKYHDMLGQAVTDANGAFTIGFDSAYFGDYAPDRAPDVFYKVSMDRAELLTTFERPQRNLARGLTQVKLEVDLPQLAPQGKDRISTQQAFKAIDWWQASDFRGVLTQTRDQTRTVSSLTGTLVGDAFKKFDFKPVQPTPVREREIINQTPDSARSTLMQQQVEVTEVKSVGDLDSSAHVKMLAGYPLNLKTGDRVTLYEDQGIVKYYTRDPAPASTADGETVARIDSDLQSIKSRVAGMDDMRSEIANVKAANADVVARAAEEATQQQAHAQELARLQKQLEQVQQASASKDVQIAKLQSDLTQVTKAQDALAARIPLDRLTALETQLSRLSPTVIRQAPVSPKPAPKRASPKSAPAETPPSKKTPTKTGKRGGA